MALLVALVGLTTFVVPLIGTDPPVLGQLYWSPLAIAQQTQLGVLPLSASSATVTAADLVLRYEDLLFGFLFAYGMLAAAFLAIVIGASVRAIRWTAGLCLAATLADVAFGHVAYQSALCAGGGWFAGACGGGERDSRRCDRTVAGDYVTRGTGLTGAHCSGRDGATMTAPTARRDALVG